LPDGGETNPVRVVLLKLILEKCKNKELQETIGGVAFFQKILYSKDPEIA
jgi:hypothetical protein